MRVLLDGQPGTIIRYGEEFENGTYVGVVDIEMDAQYCGRVIRWSFYPSTRIVRLEEQVIQ